MKKIISILLVIAAVTAGWFVYSRIAEGRQSNTLDDIVTSVVRRDFFEATVSATGSINAERSQRLAFDTAGTVAEILAHDGDVVEAGQIIARLDDTNLRLNLRQAQTSLAIAEAQLARTVAGPSEQDIRVAEDAVEIAKIGVQTAEAGVAAARANMERARAGATPEEIAIAERRVEEAKNALWGAQAQRDAICGRVGFAATQADCDQANANTQRGEESVLIAELQLQQIKAGPRPQDLASAQAQVDQALSQLENARAQVVRAENEVARIRRGASDQEIAIGEAQVQQAALNVEIAELRLEDALLVAPAAGRIADLNLYVGDSVAPGTPVATLVDLDRYHIMVSIDEVEIGSIGYDYPVHITLDAFPGQQISGRVSRIGVTGTDVQGIVVYPVRIDLDQNDLAIRPRMTAAVDIVVAQRDDALLVPNRALRRDQDGRYVELLVDQEIVRAPVMIGSSSIESTEVLEGLEEGQTIVLSRPRGNLFDLSFGGG